MDDIEKELPGFWAIIPATVRYDKGYKEAIELRIDFSQLGDYKEQ